MLYCLKNSIRKKKSTSTSNYVISEWNGKTTDKPCDINVDKAL